MARKYGVPRRVPRLLQSLLSAAAALCGLRAGWLAVCQVALLQAAGGPLVGGQSLRFLGSRGGHRASLVGCRQQPQTIDVAEQKLGYGPYKDLSYQDIVRTDPSFCEQAVLLAENVGAGPPLKRFAAYVLGQGCTAAPPRGAEGLAGEAAPEVAFGKHRGKSFREVQDQDPQYCEWVLMQAEMEDATPSFRQFADWLQATEFAPSAGEVASGVTFGKHKGKSFQEVQDQDPGYCQWVLMQADSADMSFSMKPFVDWLQATGFTPVVEEAASEMPFGKHKGKSFQEVLDQDPQYCQWVLIEAEREDATLSFRRFADWLQATGFTPSLHEVASELPFGKHKGKSYQEVLDQDPDYCQWVLMQAEREDATLPLRQFADWLHATGFTPSVGEAASEMAFGKHKGRSFQEVLDQDPDYCQWILMQAEREDAIPPLRRFADWLQDEGFSL